MSTKHALKTEHRVFIPTGKICLGLAAVVAMAVVLVDIATKWVVVRELGPQGTRSEVEILGSFVELHYALNGGVAFGLFDNNSTLAGVLAGIVIVPLVVVLAILAGRGPRWAIASGLVLGGAAGNLLDRIGDRVVTDFISIGRWPSFNVADAAISIGAVVLIALSLRERSPDHEERTNAP